MITDIAAQLAILRQGLKERRAFMRQQELNAFTSIKPGDAPRTAMASSSTGSTTLRSRGSAKR